VRVDNVPDARIWEAHQTAKRELFEEIKSRTGIEMDPDILTIGFARRATPYKRADMLFRDPQRLAQIREQRRAGSRYATLQQCRWELEQAEKLMRREGIPSLNTTHVSIEEIASKILDRFGIERTMF